MTQLTFKMGDEDAKKLERLRILSKSESTAKVLEKALGYYDLLLTSEKAGYDVIIESPIRKKIVVE